ncbi:ribonucleoprotein PTB-binding 2 isoform X2 [Spea bombifrons]|uniref:ribonucleoprotein PTB-binding 2 isoform X2 n=1 Tax=Spea bombifrons TaxID=233779 RepID=UPI002349FB0A|nr:ribonucleoprotein PTB-binding 2 isoform X2 [Spea bombifrons]
MAAVQPETALSAPPGSDTPPPGTETPQGPPLSLSPEEVKQRLQATRSELENRRKILIRNLPGDCSSQDIHDLLKDYEVKYCYVDKNKKTAFITLLNGEQAQDAIRRFHQRPLRDKELSVQLQPTDALLCVTNLPPTLTLQGFEELVRAHGSTERCLLVYSELSGRSKGYGFVEYMKKDSASKARLELLGKPLEERTLLAQWMDVNQLTADVIHSKCLCVDKLPKDLRDPEELTRLFSSPHAPVFCQLADDDGSCSAGFAVVEYESAEQAEEVRDAMDQTLVMGSKIQVSFCAPGAPGRSTLAALIAAHGMLQNNRKGLLPEPNPAQIMQSLNNPAMLQMLLQPPQRGRSGKHGASSGRPHFINPTVSQALLQLNKLHQKHGLGNSGGVLLQNYSHLQMAQQQLLQLKSAQSHNSKPGLLGEAPGSMLQTALGSAQPGAGDASQREAQKNMMPYYQHMGPDLARMSHDKQPEGSASQTLLQQSASMVTGQSQANSAESALPNKASNQTSLLGEPPREIRLSTNPYLNLASVLPGSSLAGLSTRTLQYAMDGSGSQEPSGQPALENYFSYGQQYGDYAQEAQQWYSPYAAYTTPQTAVPTEESHPSSTAAFGDYSAYVQAPPTYYASAQGTYQAGSAESIAKTTTNEKRAYTGPASEASTAEYADQYSSPEGSADTYSDTYFKRKKVF